MSQEQFVAMLPCITDDLASVISKRQSISEIEAVTKLYHSRLYALLEQEDTKIWHYSTDMLFHLLEQEEQTGILIFPDV